MTNLILATQVFINQQHDARLVEDGLIGPRTETAHRAACSFTRRGVVGCIPHGWGRASTYGGPDDYGDLYEGQSFFPIADPDGSGPRPAMYTPARYYNEIVPIPVQAYLRSEMATAERWPVLRGRVVGVSYYLDPSTYYAAARISGDLRTRALSPQGLHLRVYNPAILEGGRVREVTARVIDWGPTATWTQRLWEAAGKPAGVKVGDPWRFAIDLSPGAYAALGLKAGADRVWWEVL